MAQKELPVSAVPWRATCTDINHTNIEMVLSNPNHSVSLWSRTNHWYLKSETRVKTLQQSKDIFCKIVSIHLILRNQRNSSIISIALILKARWRKITVCMKFGKSCISVYVLLLVSKPALPTVSAQHISNTSNLKKKKKKRVLCNRIHPASSLWFHLHNADWDSCWLRYLHKASSIALNIRLSCFLLEISFKNDCPVLQNLLTLGGVSQPPRHWKASSSKNRLCLGKPGGFTNTSQSNQRSQWPLCSPTANQMTCPDGELSSTASLQGKWLAALLKNKQG